ncbi:MAG: heterodisulfide reductase-related iron-sulfur binding cluster [bacterium]
MSNLIRAEYNPLMQVHRTALRCGKCGLCRFIDNTKINDVRFSYICPSGARFRFEEYWGSGKSELARGLMTQLGATKMELEFDERLLHALYTCTLCAGCQKMCEGIGKEPLRTITALREKAVLDGEAPLDRQKELIDSILEHGNPWGRKPAEKGRWAENVRAKDIRNVEAKTLFFAGCFTLNRRLAPNAEHAVRILLKLGLDVGVLGAGETCCGAAILNAGDRRNFEAHAARHAAALNALGIETLVTACASCHRILRDEYPDVADVNFEVVHFSEILAGKLEDGGLKLGGKLKMKVTYHDPCTLGRFSGLYDEPRRVIGAIPGVELVEMQRSRGNSWCCGAGSGGEVRAQYPEFAKWTAEERLREARATGAEAIVTSCPFCEDMLSVGAGDIRVLDLAALAGAALE